MASTSNGSPTLPGAAIQVFLIAGGQPIDRICSAIQRRGFDIVYTCRMGNISPRDFGKEARWKRAISPEGCIRVTVIVAVDIEPRRPSPGTLAVAPAADNERAGAWNRRLHRWISIEDHLEIESGVPDTQVIASRNTPQGKGWLQTFLPHVIDHIRREVDSRIERYRHPFEVVASLSRFGTNAKIDLVRHRNGLAVVKTFRPGREAYLAREVAGLRACEHLGAPRLVAYEKERALWVMTEYFGDGVRSAAQVAEERGGLPLALSKRIFATARGLFELGCAHMDFQPHNVLIDKAGQVRLIDFDRFHRYDRTPRSFDHSFDLVGPPSAFKGPLPNGRPPAYETCWQGIAGLPLNSLLHEPAPLQHSRRAYRQVRSRFGVIERLDRTLRG